MAVDLPYDYMSIDRKGRISTINEEEEFRREEEEFDRLMAMIPEEGEEDED
jgi:hypothetical protein